MIRLIAAMLTFGVLMATATTAIAQVRDECLYGSCNPEAPASMRVRRCSDATAGFPRLLSTAITPSTNHHKHGHSSG
jgi:hypothetical protein